MTQAEFAKWLDSVLGNMPMEELLSPDMLDHMNRVHLENESRAWNFARMEDQQGFELTVRAMAKTMFAIGYATGREQGDIDSLFGSGAGSDWGDDADAGGKADANPSGGMPTV
jgi:hypothetical protein